MPATGRTSIVHTQARTGLLSRGVARQRAIASGKVDSRYHRSIPAGRSGERQLGGVDYEVLAVVLTAHVSQVYGQRSLPTRWARVPESGLAGPFVPRICIIDDDDEAAFEAMGRRDQIRLAVLNLMDSHGAPRPVPTPRCRIHKQCSPQTSVSL